MEAKDTVLSYLKRSNQVPMTLLTFTSKLEEQAEVSFKAGMDKVVSELSILVAQSNDLRSLEREITDWLDQKSISEVKS